MFKLAKIKLTLWYLLIIALANIFFSLYAYNGVLFFARRALISQQSRMERRYTIPQERPKMIVDEEVFEEIRSNTRNHLLRYNFIIIIIAGGMGYFLAGRTLTPIEKMIKQQKTFFSDAAHELKTPLTAQKIELEVALRNKKLNLEEAKHILQSNLEEVNQLAELSKKLLQESKYDQEETFHIEKEVNFTKIIENSVRNMRKLANEREIEVKVDLDELFISGDKEALQELVTILLDNAIKYSDKKEPIDITLKREKTEVIFKIVDHGIGMRKSDLQHIFDRFYRVDTSRSKINTDGFGLGLSIAKNIVKAHHGEIKVESTYGKGSTFIVRLRSS